MKRGLLALLGLISLGLGLANADAGFQLSEATAGLPVQSGGRIMPLDTWARLILTQWSGRSEVAGRSALQIFNQIIFASDKPDQQPLFLVNNPEALPWLGLPLRERGRYSWTDLASALAIKPEALTAASEPIQREAHRLLTNLALYRSLATTTEFLPQSDSPLRIFPSAEGEVWLNPGQALAANRSDLRDATQVFLLAVAAARQQDNVSFEAAAGVLERLSGRQVGSFAGLELWLNRVPLQLVPPLLALVGLGFYAVSRLRKTALPEPLLLWLLTAALVVQTLLLVSRMLITGRPPVTSLASSFSFTAWVLAGVGLGLHLGKIRPWGLLSGLVGLALVQFLGSQYVLEGDQYPQLQAVLDSNFWLGTHVVVITAGYGLALTASVLGHIYLFKALAVGRRQDPSHDPSCLALSGHLRLAIVLALVFTAAGTFLGGIWADQSWGRFWGWDPKENGALLIILWLALVLHAAAADLIQAWGLAVGSLLTSLVVMFSWFGINALGVGLHSYGFTPIVADAVQIFSSVEILLASLAYLVKVLQARRRKRDQA